MSKKLSIGILGSRGVPNNYGGFEQCAQYLSLELIEKGHEVSVYNSSLHPYQDDVWNNIKIIKCKDPEDKLGTFGQFMYDYHCIQDAKKRNFDITLHLGYTSSAIWFPFLSKKSHHVINMDGLEWKRNKYSPLVKKFLKLSEVLAMKFFDTHIADALEIKKYLESKYNKDIKFIPYGAKSRPKKKPEDFEYLEGQYDLIICRMEPENHVELIIEGHLHSKSILTLLIIGNTSNTYGEYLKRKFDVENVVFMEGIYDQGEVEYIRSGCRIYYHGHSVGGTNPSLLDAMASGCCICAHDNKFNREVLSNGHIYFRKVADFEQFNKFKKEDFIEDIAMSTASLNKIYNWQNIGDLYEKVFFSSLNKRG
jgi:glycosyltransferase involved in cell wall biosynthesis